MTPQHLAFMVLINLIWGFALVAGKVSLGHFPPFLFAGLRFILVMAVLFPFLKIHKGKMRQIIVIALCAGPIGFGLFFVGLSMADASVVGIVTQLGVPMSAILSVIILKEEIFWRRWLGIALSFFGIMIISFDPTVFNYINGVIIIFISAVVGSFGTIFQRQIKGVGVFELQAWVALVSFPGLFVASFLFESNQWEIVETASLLEWSGILYVAFASSLVGHAGIYYLLQRYEVSQTAPLTLLAPIFTVGFSVTLLGDVITDRMIAGALVALIGVLIVTVRQAQKGQPVPALEGMQGPDARLGKED